MKYAIRILFLILALALALFEVALRPFLPAWLCVRPLLPLLVIIVLTTGRSWAVWTAVFAGLVMDAFSFPSPDLAMLRLVLSVMLIDAISRHWLTNRSLFAMLLLTFLTRVFERGSSAAVATVGWWSGLSVYGWQADPSFIALFFWDAVLIFAGFLTVLSFSRQFLAPLRDERAWYE